MTGMSVMFRIKAFFATPKQGEDVTTVGFVAQRWNSAGMAEKWH